jgi:hypothetical protein
MGVGEGGGEGDEEKVDVYGETSTLPPSGHDSGSTLDADGGPGRGGARAGTRIE